jgi:hypothetical protein
MSNEDRRKQDKAEAKRRRDREDEQRRNSAPLVGFDGSIKVADLGGGMSINSDGHLHIGGIDLFGN